MRNSEETAPRGPGIRSGDRHNRVPDPLLTQMMKAEVAVAEAAQKTTSSSPCSLFFLGRSLAEGANREFNLFIVVLGEGAASVA